MQVAGGSKFFEAASFALVLLRQGLPSELIRPVLLCEGGLHHEIAGRDRVARGSVVRVEGVQVALDWCAHLMHHIGLILVHVHEDVAIGARVRLVQERPFVEEMVVVRRGFELGRLFDLDGRRRESVLQRNEPVSVGLGVHAWRDLAQCLQSRFVDYFNQKEVNAVWKHLRF